MAALHYQNLMVGTNNNAEHAMEDEPDPREVKIYVDNIISGAIVRVQEENPRAFKNKISPTSCGAERDMMRHGKETGNKQATKRTITFKQRIISIFRCCLRKED
ncbi:uncharacterized protein LOC111129687 [Crassostrea virginica]